MMPNARKQPVIINWDNEPRVKVSAAKLRDLGYNDQHVAAGAHVLLVEKTF